MTTTAGLRPRQKRRPDGRWILGGNVKDGRAPATASSPCSSTTLRPLSCELSCLHRADGSALWKSGSTHVLAAVYGPIAPRIPSQENGDHALVSVVIKSGGGFGASGGGGVRTTAGGGGGGVSGTTTTSHATTTTTTNTNTTTSFSSGSIIEREWEQWLTTILSSCIDTKCYARTVVEIVLQIIQNDGSVLSSALHAAVAALMDAGIAMMNLPVATTFLVMSTTITTTEKETAGTNDSQQQQQQQQQNKQKYENDDEEEEECEWILLDPTSEEERDESQSGSSSSSLLVIVTEKDNPDRLMATHSMLVSGPRGLGEGKTTTTTTGIYSGGGGLTISTILYCCQAASKATPAVVTFWRLAMEQRVTRESQTLWSSS